MKKDKNIFKIKYNLRYAYVIADTFEEAIRKWKVKQDDLNCQPTTIERVYAELIQ